MRVESPQRITINIIKWGLFATVMVLLFFMLAKGTGSASAADPDTIRANLTSAADTDKMQEGDNRMLRRLYGIDPEQLEAVTLYYPSSNMGAEELLFVRVKDQANVKGIKELIEARNGSQIKAFEGYGAEQTRMLKEAVLNEYGSDLLYVVERRPLRWSKPMRLSDQAGFSGKGPDSRRTDLIKLSIMERTG